MNDDLHGVLSRRAERARPPGNPDDVVADVIALADRRTRTRRNRLAIASGAAVVVAAATIGIAIADTGGATAHRPSGRPAGQDVGSGVPVRPSGSRVTELPKISPLRTAERSTAGRRVAVQRAQRAAHEQLQQARRARRSLLTHPTLVPVEPAPKQAEISLGLVPKSFRYLSLDTARTFYGPSGLAPSDCFSKGIVVDVRTFVGNSKNYTRTVGGKPAAYFGTTTDAAAVRIRYDTRFDIGFQLPDDLRLTEVQALKMAAALDVRSTKHTTTG